MEIKILESPIPQRERVWGVTTPRRNRARPIQNASFRWERAVSVSAIPVSELS
jgi:hypothetical protein